VNGHWLLNRVGYIRLLKNIPYTALKAIASY